MSERPSADRTAELLFWYARKPSRYEAEGRRIDAPRLDPEVILKLALGRAVRFADPKWNEPTNADALAQASRAYVRQLFFRPDPTPYQVLGLEPGASPEAIRECFRLLMQLVHPDRQVEKRRWPDACAAQANWAYSLLRDQKTRRSFEEEAEARAALARAINRAAMAAEAARMPVVVQPRKEKRTPTFAQPMLPEWLTAGVGGFVRHHPAATAFAALGTVAALIVGASLWEGRDGLLVRVARDERAAPKSAEPTPAPASEAPAASPVRPAVPAASRSASPPTAPPIVLASTAPGGSLGRAADDSAQTSAPRASSEAPQASPGATGAPSPSAVSSASAAALVPAASPDPKPSPAAAKASPDVAALDRAGVPASPGPPPASPAKADAAPAPQLAAKADAAPAPQLAAKADAPAPQLAAKVDAAPAPQLVAKVNAAPVPSPAAPVPLANAEVEALFANFVDAYERGRLDAFAALFDEDASTNLRRGRTAIRGEYDELFRLSQWRRMQLTRISWRPVGDRAVASGEITVKIKWRDGRDVEQRVAVDMELVRRDGRVVIARLSHQPKDP